MDVRDRLPRISGTHNGPFSEPVYVPWCRGISSSHEPSLRDPRTGCNCADERLRKRKKPAERRDGVGNVELYSARRRARRFQRPITYHGKPNTVAWKAHMRRQTNTVSRPRDLPPAQGIEFEL